VETYKQATYMFSSPVKGLDGIDGYQLVLKAAALQNDPAMEFGAAVVAQGSANAARRAETRAHLDRAIAGGKSDPALNASVTKHFRTTGELR
jgi:phage I-like protein